MSFHVLSLVNTLTLWCRIGFACSCLPMLWYRNERMNFLQQDRRELCLPAHYPRRVHLTDLVHRMQVQPLPKGLKIFSSYEMH